jgi:hypothetical protein
VRSWRLWSARPRGPEGSILLATFRWKYAPSVGGWGGEVPQLHRPLSSLDQSDGDDLRKLSLSMRETNLARLLARRVDGIHLAPFEAGEIGPDLFRHACLMGLEGLASKHRESVYRGGRFDRWVKVKNREHPAFSRVME